MPAQRRHAPLKRPGGRTTRGVYTICAADKGVERDWRALEAQYRSKLRFFYDYLSTTPLVRYRDRVFPLRGKLEGLWECEVGGGARLLYTVDEGRRLVVVRRAKVGHP